MFRLNLYRAVSCLAFCLLTLNGLTVTASSLALPSEPGSSESGTYIDPTG